MPKLFISYQRLVRGLQKLLKLEPGRNPVPTPEKAAAPQQVSVPVATGDVITNSIGMKLALIPAGEFMMGSPSSDRMAYFGEKPQHRVKITKSFYLGVFPVTQAEYMKVIGDNPSRYKGKDRRPVEQVTWFNAVAFCNKLSELEQLPPHYKISGDSVSIVGGSGYRLPTEAEWEYACRAGTTTKWSCGDNDWAIQVGDWFHANFGNTIPPVGEKKPNPWGLYDMHGYVEEWCWDWYGETYYKDSPANDPMGPTHGGDRVLRGGSVNGSPVSVRSAKRNCDDPSSRSYFSFGFRVARTLPPVPLTSLPPTP